MKRINDLEELKDMASKGKYVNAFIGLKFGLKSSKDIIYDKSTDTWHIFNYIDDTEQMLHTEELEERTNILEALEKGSLYEY